MAMWPRNGTSNVRFILFYMYSKCEWMLLCLEGLFIFNFSVARMS